MSPVYDLGITSSPTSFPLQQGSDNVEGVKETERRVQLLSDVLAFPVSENDYAEKERRAELRRFVLV